MLLQRKNLDCGYLKFLLKEKRPSFYAKGHAVVLLIQNHRIVVFVPFRSRLKRKYFKGNTNNNAEYVLRTSLAQRVISFRLTTNFIFISIFILFSFLDPFKTQRSFRKNEKEQSNHDGDHSTMYIIIISCVVVVTSGFVGVAIVLYKRHKKDRQKLNLNAAASSAPCHDNDKTTFRGRLTNTKSRRKASCELLFLSTEKDGCYQQNNQAKHKDFPRYEQTTSARLFSLHSQEDDTIMDDGSQVSDGDDMGGFATYVTVLFI